MKKETMNLITFILSCVCIIFFVFTLNLLAFGFALLFSCMFAIDSFWYMIKKKFIDNKIKPIGGDYASSNNSFNK